MFIHYIYVEVVTIANGRKLDKANGLFAHCILKTEHQQSEKLETNGIGFGHNLRTISISC